MKQLSSLCSSVFKKMESCPSVPLMLHLRHIVLDCNYDKSNQTHVDSCQIRYLPVTLI